MDGISPGERRELRSVVRGNYKVLRAEVKRRENELKAEIEEELLSRYRDEDAAIAAAHEEANEALREYMRTIERIGRDLMEQWPDVRVTTDYGGRLHAGNKNRDQVRRTALSRVPHTIADAALRLDKQENGLLRELSEGALESGSAKEFLAQIPTVGELVPRAVLSELEAAFED